MIVLPGPRVKARVIAQLERSAVVLAHLGFVPRAEASQALAVEFRRRFSIEHLMRERNLRHVAEDVGVSVRTVERWIIGGVTWEVADVIAAKICNDNAEHLFGQEWAALADEATAAPPSLFDDDLSDLAT